MHPIQFDQEVLQALLRTNFYAFVQKVFVTLRPDEQFQPNWHLETMCHLLNEMERGAFKRLLINIGPRSLKSTVMSVAWPAWILGHKPSERILVASYSESLAGNLAMEFRRVVQSEWYKELFPGVVITKDTELETQTSSGGFRLSVSVGGTLTGRGGNFIIVDDPLKSDEADSEAARRSVNDWFDGTLFDRLDNKSAAVIVVGMQRLHEDDLSGHLMSKPTEGVEPEYIFRESHLNLPSIAIEDEVWPLGQGRYHHRKAGEPLNPARDDLKAFDMIRKTVGERRFQAHYQQSPIPATGNIFKKKDIGFFKLQELAEKRLPVVLSIDTANKIDQQHDYTVITAWLIDRDRYYLFDLIRGKWEYPQLVQIVRAAADQHRPNHILIEDQNNGSALLQTLKQETRLNVVGIKPKMEKKVRAMQQSLCFESRRVYLLEDAIWLPELLKELLGFPNVKNDDQVDSITQFLQWASEHPYIGGGYSVSPWGGDSSASAGFDYDPSRYH